MITVFFLLRGCSVEFCCSQRNTKLLILDDQCRELCTQFPNHGKRQPGWQQMIPKINCTLNVYDVPRHCSWIKPVVACSPAERWWIDDDDQSTDFEQGREDHNHFFSGDHESGSRYSGVESPTVGVRILLEQVWGNQENLKGESVVTAILLSRMEVSYCTSGFFRI